MSKKVVVITGGTRGIGKEFCLYFLNNDCRVVFTGTSQESLDNAVSLYSGLYDSSLFLGVVADVRNYIDCKTIVEEALNKFGEIDIFISCAGIDIPHKTYHELEVTEHLKAIDVNLKGSMNCSHAALDYFSKINKGALYLMEGFGSDGRLQAGMTAYGTSKYAIRYLSKSLANEYKDTHILVGNLSPGMVATTLLTDSLHDMPVEKRMKTIKIYNILADKADTVVPYLAENILLNTKNNAKIHWLTGSKIAWRFLTSAFNKRNVIDENDFK